MQILQQTAWVLVFSTSYVYLVFAFQVLSFALCRVEFYSYAVFVSERLAQVS